MAGVHSFRSLLEVCGRIVIPAIQRDYAQGRPDEDSLAIRRTFVADLIAAVQRSPENPPMDLDFVYGRAEAGRFEPLDGQQRLTTLFLFHWWVGAREQRLTDLTPLFWDGKRSRFSYETRESARTFFDYLMLHGSELGAPPAAPPSRWLRDQWWFSLGWLRDPTVAGCLRTLDAIAEAGAGCPPMYDRLIATEGPPIVFHLLPLDEYGLSDDLYIKMNARGKPLTRFEVFKARFEKVVADLFDNEPCPHGSGETWARYVSIRFDTAWTDVLWRLRDDPTATLDARFMHLVRATALISSVLDDSAAEEPSEDLSKRLRALEETPQPAMDVYLALGCVTRTFVERFVRLCDHLAAQSALPWPEALLRRVLNGVRNDRDRANHITLEHWVCFVAWAVVVLRADRADAANEQLRPWFRWIRHLAANTAIDFALFVELVRAVTGEAPDALGGDVVEHVANGPRLRGFDRRQQREEQLKAQLRLRDARWADLLEPVEDHPVFDGSVGFLLEFCGVAQAWRDRERQCDWGEDANAALLADFQWWGDRALAIFPPETTDGPDALPGEVRDSWLWERTVLACGNPFELEWGQRSLLRTEKGRGWKRLLRDEDSDGRSSPRREAVRLALQQVDPDDIAGSLGTFVAQAQAVGDDRLAGWRQALVQEPRPLAACWHGRLHFEEGTVHVLAGKSRAGEYRDLYEHALALRMEARIAGGGLVYTKSRHFPGATFAKWPYTRVSGGGVTVEVRSKGDGFELHASLRQHVPADNMVSAGWEIRGEKTFLRRVTRSSAEAALEELSALVLAASAAD